ncbi:MAG: ABC transporter [Acidocella sp. 20-57-95]|nr:MAG: ABC transporter [Acidocella sp. 20-57-95]OYV61984.1 MAG: ABC transporter [Acidocella sp. 21-58-7]HQT65338.1 ABC transporter permease [Acidocella sp.]HQU03983.1 ABC transporter permease [Acidocella sp.]
MNQALQSARRIYGLVYRHIALYRRSWPRLLEIAYWPTLELLVWGFTANYFSHAAQSGTANPTLLAGGALIAGVLLWEVTLRGQLGVTYTFLEDIWARNLGHVFVSPLRPAELIASLLGVSLCRTLVGLLPATILAYLAYSFNIFGFGPVLLLFFLNLLVMGWWVALLIVSLLFRYGAGAEALAWTVAFGITPFACVFYPVASLPPFLQPVALALPAAHIFEGMRTALLTHQLDGASLAAATALNAFWIAVALIIFALQFRAARIRGALINIGE